VIDTLIGGNLLAKPVSRRTKADAEFATAKVRTSARNGETFFVNVVAFDAHAVTALLALDKGDSVALAGEATPIAWTANDGTLRAGLDLVVHQILTEYHVARRRKAVREPPATDLPFDDPLPEFAGGVR
jgi:single-stranded DNA-binding protein